MSELTTKEQLERFYKHLAKHPEKQKATLGQTIGEHFGQTIESMQGHECCSHDFVQTVGTPHMKYYQCRFCGRIYYERT
jgi:hypothetical protein